MGDNEHGLSRRDLLRLAAAGSLMLGGLGAPRLAAAQAPAPAIVKPLPPEWFIPLGTNAEMRWEAMAGQGYVTPSERFFVRNHTATPRIDPATWRLRISGSGLRRPEGIELSLDQLRRLPSCTRVVAIECAGNGRSLFASQQGTPASGTQWGLGAIGVARWRGVPLRELLRRAGLTRRAVDVLPEGLDAEVTGQGHVRRPLPVAKALDDVLVAYEMNGAPLPPDHGFPARLVVPGWVGIASIKWLGSLTVAAEPLFSPWSTTQYRMTGGDYPPDSAPLTTQPVKSAFELPWGAALPARRLRLHGRSWSGAAPIRHVEVRGGGERPRARLHGPSLPHAWVHWTADWRPPAPGAYDLVARATDRTGATQPDAVPFNGAGYQFWAAARHPVTVG